MTESRLRQLAAELAPLAGAERVRLWQDMRPYTTMRAGGRADVLVEIVSVEGLSRLLEYLSGQGVPHAVMGNGSNLLVADEGYHGVVLHIGDGLSDITPQPDGLLVQAGASLAAAAQTALRLGLEGLAFAHGIPGSLGGAVAMNAGAYGREMKDVVLTTYCLDGNGKSLELHGEAHRFAYRHSRIQEDALVVTSAHLRLEPGDPAHIREEMRELSLRRSDRQPLNLPSAGSVFKRPVGYFSGRLIEDCGLKGLRVGGAQVSEKHAGFIVNLGDATATDVITLVGQIRRTVREQTGVLLEPEVKLLKGERLCSF
jgi:UDP-N-acetylmuramate dehydrogenase